MMNNIFDSFSDSELDELKITLKKFSILEYFNFLKSLYIFFLFLDNEIELKSDLEKELNTKKLLLLLEKSNLPLNEKLTVKKMIEKQKFLFSVLEKKISHNWPISRLGNLEKGILLIGTYFLYYSNSEKNDKKIFNNCLNLAKATCDFSAYRIINKYLDFFYNELAFLKKETQNGK
ncbi:hypothetical protein JTY60_01535 [symbiont of Argiope bruennichi]|uniref:transcription antitermination factor NusB n=1 Tax=symbiont of Argiope bruennichi TaxID=2810479 RepID=UPI003DA57D2D